MDVSEDEVDEALLKLNNL
jgi:hypothetical protein